MSVIRLSSSHFKLLISWWNLWLFTTSWYLLKLKSRAIKINNVKNYVHFDPITGENKTATLVQETIKKRRYTPAIQQPTIGRALFNRPTNHGEETSRGIWNENRKSSLPLTLASKVQHDSVRTVSVRMVLIKKNKR